MKVLARASAGEINDKTFHLFVGLGNSGKGVLTELLKMAFISGGFVGTFNGDSLTSGERSDSDIEKSNSWIIGLMNKRFAIGNEIDRSKKLSANKIKMFASGGDTIRARLLHANACDYVPAFTPFLFVNDIPNIDDDGDAVRNRLVYHRMPYVFLEGDRYTEAIKNGSKITKRGDQSVKDIALNPALAKTFALMVIGAYEPMVPDRPKLVLDECNEWSQSGVSAESILIKMLDRTNSANDFVGNEEMNNTFRYRCGQAKVCEPSPVKLGRMLTALGIQRGKNRLGNRGYKGVKIRYEEHCEVSDTVGNSIADA